MGLALYDCWTNDTWFCSGTVDERERERERTSDVTLRRHSWVVPIWSKKECVCVCVCVCVCELKIWDKWVSDYREEKLEREEKKIDFGEIGF